MKNLHRLVMNSLFLACVLCLIPAFPMPVFLADVHANQPEASYQEAVSGHIASESAAASDSAAASEKPLPALTLMVYMCGSNLEEINGSATADLLEMMQSGFNKDEVQILVMAGGSEIWMSGYSAQETSIYRIIPGNSIRVCQLDRMNMGDPETLRPFFNTAMKNFLPGSMRSFSGITAAVL